MEAKRLRVGRPKRFKDAVFNRSSWVTAEGMASLAFRSEKRLVCCAHKGCCRPMSVLSLAHAGPDL